MSNKEILTDLAQLLGRRLAEADQADVLAPRSRFRRIARVMDRLARHEGSPRMWKSHAEHLRREMLGGWPRQPRTSSEWATAP